MILPDYFKILGLKFGASEDEIRSAYRKLSKKFHPDLNDGDQFFEEKFKELQEAYETLTDPVRKEIYIREFARQTEFSGTANNKSTQKDHAATGRNGQSSTPGKPPAHPNPKKSSSRNSLVGGIIFAASLIAVFFLRNYLRHNENTAGSDTSLGRQYNVISGDSTRQIDSTLFGSRGDGVSTLHLPDSGEPNAGANGHPIAVTKADQWSTLVTDETTRQVLITAFFSISNAKDIPCHIVAYFYDHEGTALKIDSISEYRAADGTVSSRADFTPSSDNADYNSPETALKIYLPYSVMPLVPGTSDLQYKLEIFDDKWNLVEKSGLQHFSFNIN